jgi:hypothetical protein
MCPEIDTNQDPTAIRPDRDQAHRSSGHPTYPTRWSSRWRTSPPPTAEPNVPAAGHTVRVFGPGAGLAESRPVPGRVSPAACGRCSPGPRTARWRSGTWASCPGRSGSRRCGAPRWGRSRLRGSGWRFHARRGPLTSRRWRISRPARGSGKAGHGRRRGVHTALISHEICKRVRRSRQGRQRISCLLGVDAQRYSPVVRSSKALSLQVPRPSARGVFLGGQPARDRRRLAVPAMFAGQPCKRFRCGEGRQ